MYFYNYIIASIFVLASLFLSSYAKAQTDFRDGYIIKSEGDTLHGKIDYKNSRDMTTQCVFRSASGEEVSFKPEEIMGYRFKEEKYFVSKKVNEKSYFLEFLIEGKLCVYYMEGEKGSCYFISKENEKMVELPYEQGIKYVDDKQMLYESNKHIGLLRYYTREAPSLANSINAMRKPEHESLIKLAKRYHETICNDRACIVYEKKSRLVRISLELLAGNVIFGSNEYIDVRNHNNSYLQKGGSIYFWATKKNERIFLRVSVLDITSQQGLFVPIQIGYMAPRTLRIRPTFAVGLFSPTYMGGVMVRLQKKLHLGLQSYLRFVPAETFPILPEKYHSFSLMGSLLIDLF